MSHDAFVNIRIDRMTAAEVRAHALPLDHLSYLDMRFSSNGVTTHMIYEPEGGPHFLFNVGAQNTAQLESILFALGGIFPGSSYDSAKIKIGDEVTSLLVAYSLHHVPSSEALATLLEQCDNSVGNAKFYQVPRRLVDWSAFRYRRFSSEHPDTPAAGQTPALAACTGLYLT